MYVNLATSNTTLDFGYNAYLVDATSNNITLTMPQQTGDGPNFLISRIDNSVNTVTIDGNGATINGSSTVTLGGQSNVLLVLYSDDWYTVSGAWVS